MRSLYKAYKDHPDVVFLVIEQKEPHTGRMQFAEIEQPATYEERRALAIKCRDEFQLEMPILVDGMDDSSRALFGDLPSPSFIVDETGLITHKFQWASEDLIVQALAELAARPTTRPLTRPDLRQAVAHSRARLVAKDARSAITAIETALAASRDADPALEAEARLTLAVARGAEGDARAAALSAAAAETAARKAWSSNQARLVAALCELASLEPGSTARWDSALSALETRAPKSLRAWIESKRPRPETAPSVR